MMLSERGENVETRPRRRIITARTDREGMVEESHFRKDCLGKTGRNDGLWRAVREGRKMTAKKGKGRAESKEN